MKSLKILKKTMEESEYKSMYEQESKHWWFKGRKRIFLSLIKKRYKKGIKILDFGCGTGINIKALEKFGNVKGIDVSKESKRFCKKRGINVKLLDISKKSKKLGKYRNKFDLITSFDVLEHIDNDSIALKNLNDFLKDDGRLLITVPAFNFLWSNHDVVLHHKRRYAKKALKKLLEKSGFKIELLSYYNFFIFPAILIRKIINPKASSTEISNTKFNWLFDIIYSLEIIMINLGLIPWGSSIICMAKKQLDE